jgi:hypothetical protein
MQITTIGLDIAKNVFQVHGIDAAEKIVVRKQLRCARSKASVRVFTSSAWKAVEESGLSSLPTPTRTRRASCLPYTSSRSLSSASAIRFGCARTRCRISPDQTSRARGRSLYARLGTTRFHAHDLAAGICTLEEERRVATRNPCWRVPTPRRLLAPLRLAGAPQHPENPRFGSGAIAGIDGLDLHRSHEPTGASSAKAMACSGESDIVRGLLSDELAEVGRRGGYHGFSPINPGVASGRAEGLALLPLPSVRFF